MDDDAVGAFVAFDDVNISEGIGDALGFVGIPVAFLAGDALALSVGAHFVVIAGFFDDRAFIAAIDAFVSFA